MRAAAPRTVAPASASRLLAHVQAFGEQAAAKRPPAQLRLEAALGRDFADRLVSALSEAQADDRLGPR